MRRRTFVALAAGAAAWRPAIAPAERAKVPVIGVLVVGKPDPMPTLRLFREELKKLGYVEGHNVRIEIRSANGHAERLPELAAALVRERVDVIGAWMTPTVLAAKRATTEVPIVMIGVADPVGSGIVASLARPGGNVTGMAGLTAELAGKHIELLKEALPGLDRIAALGNTPDPFSKTFLEQIQLSADSERVEIVPVMVAAAGELNTAFPAMVEQGIAAVIVQPSLPLKDVADLALRYRLPSGCPLREFPQLGGLIGYSAETATNQRQAARILDKILKGANPADLPVEQPTKFELVINLNTAKALGLTVPQSLLARADEVIE